MKSRNVSGKRWPCIIPRAFLTISLSVLVLCPAAGAKERVDSLHPCLNPLTSSGQFSDYFTMLNRLFFRKHHHNMLSMVTFSSSEKEGAVSVYLTEARETFVDYVRSEKQIWTTMSNNGRAGYDDSIEFTPPESIKVKSYQRSISLKTADILDKTWFRVMQKTRMKPAEDSRFMEETRHYFFYSESMCSAYPLSDAGPTVKKLKELGEALKRYAKKEGDVTEESILKRAEELARKLEKTN